MKTKSLFIAALVVVSAVVSAAGKEERSNTGLAVVPVRGSEVFKVIYKSENVGRVKLNIYNADAKIIFSETISGVDGFIRPLNFNGLASGEYTVEIVTAAGKKMEKINFAPIANLNHIHVGKIANEEGKFLLAVASEGNEQIKLRILDSENNVLHSEVKNISGDYAQLYNLKNVKGEITFEITDKAGNTSIAKF